jgi:hypothetical protein
MGFCCGCGVVICFVRLEVVLDGGAIMLFAMFAAIVTVGAVSFKGVCFPTLCISCSLKFGSPS